MKFCSECGSHVVQTIPAGDNRPRFVCPDCDTIHYQNPKMVVGTLPVWEDKVLLCKRAIEPQYGKWTLPAGFMENHESTQEGALRETFEEAGARVEIDQLYTLYNLPYISQVYIMFRARLLDLEFVAGTESLEVALFSEADIPWDQLAFRTIEQTLRRYFEDRRNGGFGFHTATIARNR